MGLKPRTDFILQGPEESGGGYILFRQVLPLLEAGLSDEDIRCYFPDLSDRKLIKARTYYQAILDPQENGRFMRVLCDENISREHLFRCQEAFNYATSVALEGITGADDQAVWQHACREGYHFILTRDQRTHKMVDLTRIAVCAWHDALTVSNADDGVRASLPVVLHVVGRVASDSKKFSAVLQRNLSGLFDAHARGDAAVLKIGDGGLHTEISAHEIAYIVSPSTVFPHTRREAQWARAYLRKVLPERAWADRETPRVLQIKRRVTRAVAMAARVPRSKRRTQPRMVHS